MNMYKVFGRKNKKRKGFTLIELIVVIAILGILAAIAVPRLSNFTTSAQSRADEADVRIMEGAAQMLIAEVGIASAAGTYEDADDSALEDYVDEWPTSVTSVSISTDGEITVSTTAPASGG